MALNEEERKYWQQKKTLSLIQAIFLQKGISPTANNDGEIAEYFFTKDEIIADDKQYKRILDSLCSDESEGSKWRARLEISTHKCPDGLITKKLFIQHLNKLGIIPHEIFEIEGVGAARKVKTQEFNLLLAKAIKNKTRYKEFISETCKEFNASDKTIRKKMPKKAYNELLNSSHKSK